VTVRIAAHAGTADSLATRVLVALAAGSPIVVIDDQTANGEGFLVMAAEAATTSRVSFFVRHCSGLLCVALPGADCDRLHLPLMYREPTRPLSPASCVAVDAAAGTSTGISARDRARTIALLADANSSEDDFIRPGHVIPVRCAEGGVLRRAGIAEAAVDLALTAGCRPAGLFSAIVGVDQPTELARGRDLDRFTKAHGLQSITVSDLLAFRRMREPMVSRCAMARLPIAHDGMVAVGYRGRFDESEHVVLLAGEPDGAQDFAVYIHQECLTDGVSLSTSSDCGHQLEAALSTIAAEGRGAVAYVRPLARSTGMAETDEPPVAVVAAHILRDLGVQSVVLLQDHAGHRATLQAMGLRTRNTHSPVPPFAECDRAGRREN
jgi:3,4-dihydroxy 2-butanone 4-phosphate synthase/GTP cyclohydrolase II